jgi:1,4-dihydroxy-2-naphthoate polyprenyltransferase
MNAVRHPRLAAWYSATRPRVFTATFVPMGVAAAVALQDGVFRIVPFALALIGTMLLQTAANLINEYFDYRRGADEGKEAGQGMIIKRKVLTPREVLTGAVASVAAGSLIGLVLLAHSGPLLWAIGIGGVFVAITYTAGPYPLAYHGLGEIAAGIFMGPMIVVGAYYVMDTSVYPELMLISLPVALMVAAILHANNIRDRDADRAVNKRTLAVRFGMGFARAEYAFLVFGAYVSLAALAIFGLIPWAALIVTVPTMPEAYRLVRVIYTHDDTPTLHMAQGRTARLHGQFGLAIVAGWLVWLLVERLLG